MSKVLKVLFCFVIVDFFFFSTRMSFSLGLNTKEWLALAGIFFFIADLYRNKLAITREFLMLLFLSFAISLLAIFSSVYHNTPNKVYTTYFMSMLTWLGGAFAVVSCLKLVHKTLSIEQLAAYIVAVAVAQGLIAVIADNYAPLDNFILRTIPGMSWMKSENRLYGFGETATLDTGGIRFAIALILCAHNLRVLVSEKRLKLIPLYVLAFLIITVTGNMVARTTLVGTIVGLAYLFIYVSPFKLQISLATLQAWLWILAETLIIIIIIAVLYDSDENFRSRTRFAFEGFFSIVEEGHWETGSNNKLKSMYVFPDNMKTWIIGDGYFTNPKRDPNYVGEITRGYYMNTDVGYLRFIFFFGLIGLSVYSLFIIYAGRVCARLLPGNTLLFILLTSMNFIIWLKVATDCFFILCLFICLGYLKNSLPDEATEAETLIIQDK